MQIVVLSDEIQKKELLDAGAREDADIRWISSSSGFSLFPDADGYMDLLFENHPHRIRMLSALLPKPVLVNSVSFTLSQTHSQFVRINAWHTFLSASTVEAAAAEEQKIPAARVLEQFQKQPVWLPDQAGFITPRIVAMIINEAYLALSEGVSSVADIDTAMKLGTNYPYGPFEWAQLIGIGNITSLLQCLGEKESFYLPSPLMVSSHSS